MKTLKDLIKAIRDYSEIPDNRPTANRMFKAWADWLEKYAEVDHEIATLKDQLDIALKAGEVWKKEALMMQDKLKAIKEILKPCLEEPERQAFWIAVDALKFKRFCDNCGKKTQAEKGKNGVFYCLDCGGEFTPIEDLNDTPK